MRIEKELALEKEVKQLRDWRQNYWGDQAKKLHEEDLENRAKYQQEVLDRHNKSIERTKQQWSNRELTRARLQVEAPLLSAPIILPSGEPLGVYGIPMEPGAYHSQVGGGYVPGLDQKDVEIFSSEPHTEYELRNVDYADVSAELSRTQGLYESLKVDSKALDVAIERMCQMRDVAEKDLHQVGLELTLIEKDQLGPPRRLPLPTEVETTSVWKEKQALVKKHIEDIQHSIDVAHNRKLNAESQMLTLAKSLAVLREKNKKADQELQDVNTGFGMLPMVVGRNISKVAGMNELAKPLETFNAITQQSKLVHMKELSSMAVEAHREVVKFDRKIWVARQGDDEARDDVDRTINKLAEISERLQKSFASTIKQNLLDAILCFHRSKAVLHVVKIHHHGPLGWWVHRKVEDSSNVVPFTDGVALGALIFEEKRNRKPVMKSNNTDEDEGVTTVEEGTPSESEAVSVDNNSIGEAMWGVKLGHATSGICVGTISLPKLSLWRVFLTVSRPRHQRSHELSTKGDESGGDATDHCVVHLGTSESHLARIGVYYNKINPKLSAVLYDVRYIFKGDTLAFRFQWSSSSSDPDLHLGVSVGVFEEYEPIGLEVHDNLHGLGKERVVSSYVKILRIEESQGRLRLNRLLEELIYAEASTEKFWMSDVITGVQQTYKREMFLRIMRAEILVEQRLAKEKMLEHPLQSKTDLHSSILSMTQEKLDRLKESESNYLRRKRSSQQPLIAKAMSEIGKRLDIFTPSENKWKHVYVINIYINWIENGTVLKVYHILQEFNSINQPMGDIFYLDISGLKYFESPAHLLDETMLQRFKAYERWSNQLNDLDIYVQEGVLKAREGFEDVKRKEEELVREETESLLSNMDDVINQEIKDLLKTSESKKAMRSLVKSMKEELRAGLITIDPNISLNEQAKKVAQARYIEDYTERRKKEILNQIRTKQAELEMSTYLNQQQLMKEEDRLKKIASRRRRMILEEIRTQKQAEMQALATKVKFDPNEFKRAVPQATLCEHLRSKAWGNKYGKGVYCVSCSKEMTELHLEESQILGYGSGTDPSFYDAVKRHRFHEAAFKFRNSEELEKVEEERIRLEKERRIMDLDEKYFYDFDDIKVNYEFDRRHAPDLKAEKVFRQGVQWTELELQEFEKKVKINEMKKVRESGYVVEAALENFDTLRDVDIPPPTFRAADDRKRAQYKDLMYMMGRLNNFQKRISDLKTERVNLIIQRAVYSDVLVAMHKQSFIIEDDVRRLEEDLDRTAQLFQIYHTTEHILKQAQQQLERAKKVKKKAELRRAGLWDDVKETKARYDGVHDQTRAILKLKFTFELDLAVRSKLVEDTKNILESHRREFETLEAKVTGMQYCQPGSMILTLFGLCRVRLYRTFDEMILVSLPFCRPAAKAWFYAPAVIAQDRARQEAERILMQLEDEAMKVVLQEERQRMKRELYLMSLEEAGVKEYYALIDLAATEANIIADRVTSSVNDGYIILRSKQYKALHHSKFKIQLNKEIIKHNDTIKNYKGRRNQRPKPLSLWTLGALKKRINVELKNKFLAEVCLI